MRFLVLTVFPELAPRILSCLDLLGAQIYPDMINLSELYYRIYTQNHSPPDYRNSKSSQVNTEEAIIRVADQINIVKENFL